MLLREFRAERERVNVHIARATKLTVERRHVKCIRRFVLKLHKLRARVVTGKQFRDGVGEIA